MSKDKRRVGVYGLSQGCDHLSWEHVGAFSHRCEDCNEWLAILEECQMCAHLEKPDFSKSTFVTKDSGKREEYASGMRRDVQEGKPRFDLLLTDGLPFEEQFITRFASLLERGATKYGERNWQLATSEEELSRFRASGLRHMMQWACGEVDEDHASAVAFNLMAYEYTKWKMNNE